MHTGQPLSARLAAFRQNFKQILGSRRQGYDELSQLEQPLVGGGSDVHSAPQHDADYARNHGVPPPGSRSQPAYGPPTVLSPTVPSQIVFPGSGFSTRSSSGRRTTPVALSGFPSPGSTVTLATENLSAKAGQIPSGAGQIVRSCGCWDQSEDLRQLVALGREAAEIMWEMAALQDHGEAAAEMAVKSGELQAQLRGMIGDYRDADESTLAAALEVFDLLSNTLEEYEAAQAAPGSSAPQPSLSAGVLPTSSNAAVLASPDPAPSFTGNPFQAKPFQVGLPPPPDQSRPPPASSVLTAPGHKPVGDEAPLIDL